MPTARPRGAALPLLLGGAALLLAMLNGLWTDSVDLAHHYALVARLSQHWVLAGADPSLGEMNQYPRGAHLLGAVLGKLGGSPLLGLQLTAVGALLAIWLVLLTLLRTLPARAATLGALTLAALLLLNRQWLRLELHGGELLTNFFYAQLVGQAAALLAVLATLRLERAGLASAWRHLGLLLAIPLVCTIHLLPASELLMVLGWSALCELPAARRAGRGQLALTLLAPLAGAALLYLHPSFAVMKEISANEGGLPTAHLASMGAFAAYAGAVLLLGAALLHGWRTAPPAWAARALGMKYVALYGLACALMCLLQLLALRLGAGSAYAVKKYVFGLHSAMLLEWSLLPALALAWRARHQARAPAPAETGGTASQLGAMLGWPALLALATLGQQPATPPVKLAPLVALERQLGQLRDSVLPATPGHATYVTQVPGLSPMLAYMFTIGVFGTPRTDNAYDVMGGQGPRDTRLVDTILTHPDAPYGRIAGCRRPGGTAALAIMDGPCVDQTLHPAGAHVGMGARDPAPPCVLSGWSQPNDAGRWTIAPVATLDCARPTLNGQPARAVRLATYLPAAHTAGRHLLLSVDGAPPVRVDYDPNHPARRLMLALPDSTGARVRLTITLPDAHATQAPGPMLTELNYD